MWWGSTLGKQDWSSSLIYTCFASFTFYLFIYFLLNLLILKTLEQWLNLGLEQLSFSPILGGELWQCVGYKFFFCLFRCKDQVVEGCDQARHLKAATCMEKQWHWCCSQVPSPGAAPHHCSVVWTKPLQPHTAKVPQLCGLDGVAPRLDFQIENIEFVF